MMKEDVLNFAKKVAPWLTAAATGNVPALITMAAGTISNALGVTVEPTADAVVNTLSTATAAELLALKQAEQDFQLKMHELDYKQISELDAAAYADTASARNRDVDLMKTTGSTNKRASVMLGATMGFLVGLVILMVVKEINANTALGGVVVLLIGKFSNAWDTAFQFEFGTNRSSKGKDETIAAMAATTSQTK